MPADDPQDAHRPSRPLSAVDGWERLEQGTVPYQVGEHDGGEFAHHYSLYFSSSALNLGFSRKGSHTR